MSTDSETVVTRDIRQRELVPREALALCHALIVGVGAIGRQVALQLSAMGMPNMTLVDHDAVGIENLAAQGYWPTDIGRLKVEATGEMCRSILPAIQLYERGERFSRSRVAGIREQVEAIATRLIVFACVDQITIRQMLFESTREHAACFIDGRMAAEVLRVLTVDQPSRDSYYGSTLFRSEQAYRGSCTARSTIYTASLAASLMITQFTRWLRGQPVDRDLTLNLLAMELTLG